MKKHNYIQSQSQSQSQSHSSRLFCNNCNKAGHIIHHCRYPVISLGIVACCKDSTNKLKYLMVQRKNTHGFTDFVRGKYSVNNLDHIQKMVDEMTVSEKELILTKDFNSLWVLLWGGENNKFLVEKQYAKEKFNDLKRGIKIINLVYTLSSIVKKSSTRWAVPEWGFPKGRKNFKENNIDCAIREWSEETGYHKNKLNIFYNIIPYQEIFIGSNFKTYKQIYYLAYFPYDKNLDYNNINYDKVEIGDAKWCNIDECKLLIRNYNLEKLKIITKIDNILTEYKI